MPSRMVWPTPRRTSPRMILAPWEAASSPDPSVEPSSYTMISCTTSRGTFETTAPILPFSLVAGAKARTFTSGSDVDGRAALRHRVGDRVEHARDLDALLGRRAR